MSRYRGRRSGGSSRLIPFIIALLVAIAAIVLVIINVTKDKNPADDVVDDAQQGDVMPDDTLPDEGDDTTVEDEPQHVVIEVQGDEERYDAVYRVGDTGYEMYTYVESTAKKYADNINAIADAVAGTATVYMLPAPLSSGITLPDALYGKDIFSDQKAAEDGIIGFMNDFDIIENKLNEPGDYASTWRFFDMTIPEDLDTLPEDSSLRRRYKALMKRGEPIGSGFGVFFA